MKKRCIATALLLFVVALFAFEGQGLAHVPYLEYVDYSFERPMELEDPITKSRAFYSWFETGEDVDVYAFEVTGPTRVFAQALVPVCSGYEDILPWFAIAGPGLPPPAAELPFELPPGYGAWVVQNAEPWTPRETFYEPFGDKWYFDGPTLDQEVYEMGTWYVYYWNPYGKAGDYVAVVGPEEIWEIPDILRALVFTPMIRNDEELHISCIVCPFIDDRVLEDGDEDTIGDLCDNCPDEPNPYQVDQDQDHHGAACDCDDANPEIHPGKREVRGDGIDSNCSPAGCPGGLVEPGSRCDNCFIATAAFGTEMADKIDVLRDFRDQWLLKRDSGRRFVELYYRYSPPAAEWIAGRQWRRSLTRILLLPIVGFVSFWV